MPCPDNCHEVNCDACNACEETSPTLPQCETPNYTEVGCWPPGQHTECISSDVESDSCLGTEKGEKLTTFLTKVLTFIKGMFGKITPDSTVVFEPSGDPDCPESYNIAVRISEEEGNIITKKDDGLYAAGGEGGTTLTPKDTDSINITITPDDEISANVILDTTTNGGDNIAEITEHGLYIGPSPVDCDAIKNTHSAAFSGTDTNVRFSITSDQGCKYAPMPLGFAVVGPTRKSAFGPQEFYSTLNAANTAASSGETVILLTDSTDNLTMKNGVNYYGIGIRKVGSIVVGGGSPYKGYLFNIEVTGTALIESSSPTNRTQVHAVNTTVKGDVILNGYSDWFGGEFKDISKKITANNFSTINNIYSERAVYLNGAAKIKGSSFVDKSNTDISASMINASMTADTTDNSAIINCTVESDVNGGITALSLAYPGIIVTKNTVITKSGKGLYYHCGFQNEESSGLCSNNDVQSDSGIGIEVVKAGSFDDDPEVVNNYCFVVNNTGNSKTNVGIHSIGASLKSCHGFSEDAPGIRVAGSDFSFINTKLENCSGESINSVGCSATRNIHILGGAYTSHKYATDGHAILLGSLNIAVPGEHYYIKGAILTTAHPGAYKIARTTVSALPISIRDGGNHFQCPNGTASVAGVDPLLVRLPTLIDSNGNFTY